MNYQGVLTITETQEFFSLFYDLEIGRMTAIYQCPIDRSTKIGIVLIPFDFAARLLDSSFEEGLLGHHGWAEKFQKFDEPWTGPANHLMNGNPRLEYTGHRIGSLALPQ